jgi:outer membrane protein W
MKKIKNTFVVTLILVSAINSNSFSQCVKQGDIIVDAYYGFPYLWGTLVKSAYDSAGTTGTTFHNTNHLGGKFEYMATDKIGVGVEYTYANTWVNFPDNGKIYSAGIKKQRILAKMNIHFATSEKLDPYFTVGAGYKAVNIYSTDPNDKVNYNFSLLPVAFRTSIGLRFFFTENIGINAEVGIGGPIMQAGLSVKF